MLGGDQEGGGVGLNGTTENPEEKDPEEQARESPRPAKEGAETSIQVLVLSCCMLNKEAYLGMIREGLHSAMFTGRNQKLFKEIVLYRADLSDVNEIAVENLKVEGFSFVDLSIMQTAVYDQGVGSTALHPQYFEALKKQYLKREAARIIRENKELDYRSIGNIAEGLAALQAGRVVETGEVKEAIKEAIDEVEKRQAITFENPFKLGLKTYDQLGHFDRGTLLVLGGESGHGKSALALNMVYRWLQNDLRIVYFSFEMTKKVIVTKLNLIHTNLDWDRTWVTKGERLSDGEFRRLIDGFGWFFEKPLLINTRASSVQEMEAIVMNHEAQVFVLDTINALIGHDERQDIYLGDIARRWKRIADEIGGLGIVIAQLRDVPGRPSEKSLVRESRQIGEIADYIDLIYREDEKKLRDCDPALQGKMELFRVKGRLVGVGKEIVGFDPKSGIIRDLGSEEYNAAKDYLRSRRGKG